METLKILGILAGLGCIAWGILMVFAGGMSDAPQLGDTWGRNGCILAAVSLVVLIGCIVALVL